MTQTRLPLRKEYVISHEDARDLGPFVIVLHKVKKNELTAAFSLLKRVGREKEREKEERKKGRERAGRYEKKNKA